MKAIDEMSCTCLIFVPGNSKLRNELGPMKEWTVNHWFEFRRDKTLSKRRHHLHCLAALPI